MRCSICDKEKVTLRCSGCLQEYCSQHLQIHRQELNQQFQKIENHRDEIRQLLTEQIRNFHHEQIDQWEEKTIEIIRQTAEQARDSLRQYSKKYLNSIEINLAKITQQLRQCRQDDEFNEIHLQQFQEQLQQLNKELHQPADVIIREESHPSIRQIFVESTWMCNIHHHSRWNEIGRTIAGGNGHGQQLNQLHFPFSIAMDNENQTMYIADYENHRIVKWKCGANEGEIIAGGNGRGNQMNQLNHPTDVVLDRQGKNLIICDQDNRRIVQWSYENPTIGQTILSNIDCRRLTIDEYGYLYVCDRRKHEIRRWKLGDRVGVLVAGGHGKGDELNQLNEPSFIFVDRNRSIYISDYQNHRIMKWMKDANEGILLTNHRQEHENVLLHPQGIIADHLGNIYVVDSDNHRVLRWFEGAREGNVIVDGKANQLSNPRGLAFDQQGHLYVVDCENHRIQKFDLEQS